MYFGAHLHLLGMMPEIVGQTGTDGSSNICDSPSPVRDEFVGNLGWLL